MGAGDGSISFDEFRQLLQKYKSSKRGANSKEVSSPASSSASEYDLRETFDIFDKDADGYLNAVDLRSVVRRFFLHCLHIIYHFLLIQSS